MSYMKFRSPKWDRRFMELAKLVASWSKDPSTQVGAVLVDDYGVVVGMGYNGFARGIHDSDERYADRPTKYKLIVHAEVNAIINAGHAARGTTLFVWPPFAVPNTCADCCKVVIQAGIKRIVSPKVDDSGRDERWKESLAAARDMCREAGIIVDELDV